MNILIGADPELFVQDKEGDIISGHGLIEGTKEEPFPVKDGAVQVDGMALEFNIDPADSEDAFVHNIQSVLSQMEAMIPEFKLVVKPSHTFTEEYLKSQPKEALELGCEPDFNAWTGKVNPAPNAESNMRTCGGHIHIGWTEGADITSAVHISDCEKLVRALDTALLPAASLFDKDFKRRNLYGAIGSYRPKEYGVEYRVLSNAWLKDEKITRYVYRLVNQVIEKVLNGWAPDDKWLANRFAVLHQPDHEAKRVLRSYGLEVLDV